MASTVGRIPIQKWSATLIKAAVESVHPRHVIPKEGLPPLGPHIFMSSGKGSLESALAFASRPEKDQLAQMVVVYKEPKPIEIEALRARIPVQKLQLFQGDHPEPGEKSLAAYKGVKKVIQEAGVSEMVACVHGGTSSLLYYSEETRQVRRACLSMGVPVEAINAIFREISPVSGGGLASFCAHNGIKRLHVLGFSDVSGDHLYDIGSGPFEPNPSLGTAAKLLTKYKIWEALDSKVARSIEALLMSPEPRIIPEGTHRVVASKIQAVEAIRTWALTEGLNPVVLAHEFLNGPAEERAAAFLEQCRRVSTGKRPTLVIANGESVLTLPKNPGEGGRARHSAAIASLNCPDGISGFFLGTDGGDGPLPKDGRIVAGAYFGKAIREAGEEKGLSLSASIKRCDTHPYFKDLGYDILTGPTGVNVSDIAVGLIE